MTAPWLRYRAMPVCIVIAASRWRLADVTTPRWRRSRSPCAWIPPTAWRNGTVRVLAAAQARGGEVVVECPAELANLFAECGIADRIVLQGGALPCADLHLHQCSLPGLFSRTEAAISGGPYITANPARVAAFAALLGPRDGRKRVGIVWSGSISFARNAERAQALGRFLTAFDQHGVQLFSLQNGPPEAELRAHPGHDVIDLAPHLVDFADTAAAIACLDLIIMCDSAVAHLAGAMGCEVWLLLGQDAHWLWMQGRTASPWYSSMRLFRPRGEGDWEHVFDQAASRLMRSLQGS